MKNIATVSINLIAQFETDLDQETFTCKLQAVVDYALKIMSSDGSVHNSRIAGSDEVELLEFEDNSVEEKENSLQATNSEAMCELLLNK